MTDPTEPPKKAGGRGSGGFLAFWTTLPGILTGVAALITAIVGLATLVHSWTGDGQTESQSGTAVASSSSTTMSSGSGASGDDSAGATENGRLALHRGDEADLEQGLIGLSPNDDVMFGPESTPYLHAAGTAFLAPLQKPPSKAKCRDALAGRRDAFEAIEELSAPWVCVSTSESHIAFVEILQAPGVGSAELDLKYTVWH
jgi:hypothetical protein